MSHYELNGELLAEARQAEANALAYMIVSLVALALAIALIAWAIWA
ncbi:hypothetical protein SAMN02927924_02790 [Sphingobium faniae]|nr:hypothetical protein SAMN02927924_02790 [Sphingobium faniae]